MRWRRHWKIPVALVALLAVLLVGFGESRLARLTSTTRTNAIATADLTNIEGTVDIFDPTVEHEITIEFDVAEYEAAIDAFIDDGDKDFIEADVVIDGTVIDKVGIRLKGNSTLLELADDEAGGSDDGGQTAFDVDDVPPGGFGGPQELLPELFDASILDADDPTSLPWLIRFDEYVDGVRYQDQRELVIRPGTVAFGDGDSLAEAVALGIIDAAGAPAEQAVLSRFSINGAPAISRLVVEHPGDAFTAANFDRTGALYKALVDGSFTYVGDDPLDYADAFRQITRRNQQDLAPLIEFVAFVDQASDATFENELGEWLDVDAFASYLALHNLLLDADDIGGPGQNYYLFWELASERFTVVSWDLNSSFTGDAALEPYTQPTFEPLVGADPAALPTTDHALRSRFLATPTFQLRYEQAYRRIYTDLFASGEVFAIVDRWQAHAGVALDGDPALAGVQADLVDLRSALADRTAALSRHPVVTAADADLPVGPDATYP